MSSAAPLLLLRRSWVTTAGVRRPDITCRYPVTGERLVFDIVGAPPLPMPASAARMAPLLWAAIVITQPQAAALAQPTVSVDFTEQQRIVPPQSGMYNVVRHGAFWGEALAPRDPLYASSFAQMGTQHVCIFLYEEMDDISPAPTVYNFSKLEVELDDMLGMGFSPFIRFGAPPSWVGNRTGSSSAAHLTQQIDVIKTPALRAQFFGVTRGIAAHLLARYGPQTRQWAFSCLNEVGLYTPQLSGGNWDIGSHLLAVAFSEFAAAVTGVDRGLRAGGGLESTNSYELMYYVVYLHRTNQTSLLSNVSFLDHHHYGYCACAPPHCLGS